MSWNQYDGSAWKAQIARRSSLILLGIISVGIIIGFVVLLNTQDGDVEQASKTTSLSTPERTPTTTPQGAQSSSDPVRSGSGRAVTGITDADRTAAIDAATKFVTAYANPQLSKEQWLEGIRPYVTTATFAKYQTVNIENLTSNAVTGEPRIENIELTGSSVAVPTDGGPLRVVLNPSYKVTYVEPMENPADRLKR